VEQTQAALKEVLGHLEVRPAILCDFTPMIHAAALLPVHSLCLCHLYVFVLHCESVFGAAYTSMH